MELLMLKCTSLTPSTSTMTRSNMSCGIQFLLRTEHFALFFLLRVKKKIMFASRFFDYRHSVRRQKHDHRGSRKHARREQERLRKNARAKTEGGNEKKSARNTEHTGIYTWSWNPGNAATERAIAAAFPATMSP